MLRKVRLTLTVRPCKTPIHPVQTLAVSFNKMKKIILILVSVLLLGACVKSRLCECYENTAGVTDTMPEKFYINGNKKDSKKACTNLADSNEVCNLK